MKRRGFLKTLAGLAGVAATPALSAAPKRRRYLHDAATHTDVVGFGLAQVKAEGQPIAYDYGIGYRVDLVRETVERIG